MSIKILLPKINAFVMALNDHGITSAAVVNEHLSIVVGCSLAATHVNVTNCFIIDESANNTLLDDVWWFNNTIPINYDLAMARARDVINTAYSHITFKGYTSCTAPMISLGESETPLMSFPEAHALFLTLNDVFCLRDKERRNEVRG